MPRDAQTILARLLRNQMDAPHPVIIQVIERRHAEAFLGKGTDVHPVGDGIGCAEGRAESAAVGSRLQKRLFFNRFMLYRRGKGGSCPESFSPKGGCKSRHGTDPERLRTSWRIGMKVRQPEVLGQRQAKPRREISLKDGPSPQHPLQIVIIHRNGIDGVRIGIPAIHVLGGKGNTELPDRFPSSMAELLFIGC